MGACPGPWEVHSVIKFILWNWSNSWGLLTAGACIAGPDQCPVTRPGSWWHVTMSAAPGSSSASDGSDPGLVIVLQTPGSLWWYLMSNWPFTPLWAGARADHKIQSLIYACALSLDWLWLLSKLPGDTHPVIVRGVRLGKKRFYCFNLPHLGIRTKRKEFCKVCSSRLCYKQGDYRRANKRLQAWKFLINIGKFIKSLLWW